MSGTTVPITSLPASSTSINSITVEKDVINDVKAQITTNTPAKKATNIGGKPVAVVKSSAQSLLQSNQQHFPHHQIQVSTSAGLQTIRLSGHSVLHSAQSVVASSASNVTNVTTNLTTILPPVKVQSQQQSQQSQQQQQQQPSYFPVPPTSSPYGEVNSNIPPNLLKGPPINSQVYTSQKSMQGSPLSNLHQSQTPYYMNNIQTQGNMIFVLVLKNILIFIIVYFLFRKYSI